MRIPVAVEQDHCIRSGEVDSQSTGPGRDEEHKHIGIGIELVDERLSLGQFRGTVQSNELPVAVVEVILQEIEDLGHLREEDHLERKKIRDECPRGKKGGFPSQLNSPCVLVGRDEETFDPRA
jgi:hypothetical protein